MNIQPLIHVKQTMSSVEVAELTGKEHRNVLADIRNMFEALDLNAADFSATQKYGNNNTKEIFNLPKRETLILTSGYSVKQRASIIDRWIELESTQAIAPVLPAYTTTQRIDDTIKVMDGLERLGMMDDRDRLYLADSLRNASLPMLPQAVDIQPVTISSRINELGLKASRGQLSLIGRATAALYKAEYDVLPIKHTQYVDGAPRKVNSYTSEHLELIDQAINEVLE